MILEQIRIMDNAPIGRRSVSSVIIATTTSRSASRAEDAPYALVDYALGIRKLPLVRQGPGLHNDMLTKLRNVVAAIEKDSKYILRALHFDDAKGLLRIDFAITTGEQFCRGSDLRRSDPQLASGRTSG